MRRRMTAAVLALGVRAASAGAQQVEMEIDEPVRVLAAPLWGALVEPHLATHPTEPRIAPLDPTAILGAVAVLVGIGIAASWIPARRTRKVEPARVLRGQ